MVDTENKNKQETIIKCPECSSTDIIIDSRRGERTCSNCGLVIADKEIDQGPEWRSFTSDELNKRSRVGSPITYTVHDKGLSTMIDWHDKDYYGKTLSPRKKAQVHRLRMWHIRTRVHSSIDRNLAFAMNELDRLSSQLGIPRGVKESSAVFYRKAIDKKLIRGRSIEAMIAAAIYAACRLLKVPRTLDEIARYSRVNRKELGRCYRLILRELNIKIPTADPIEFIPRFGAELELSGRTQKRAAEIIKRAGEYGLTAGKDPTGLAAASIYISAILEGERRTQREIAEVAHVTEVTVRNRYKELVKVLNINIDI